MEIKTLEEFAKFFDNFLNRGGKQFRDGVTVGKILQTTHRTLQRCAIAFALGIIYGLGETDPRFTDPRNKEAILFANKIKEEWDKGQIDIGAYI